MLGLEQLALQSPVGPCPLLMPIIRLPGGAGAQAAEPVLVMTAQVLRRVWRDPFLSGERVQPAQCGLGGAQASLIFLPHCASLVTQVKSMDQLQQCDSLEDQR